MTEPTPAEATEAEATEAEPTEAEPTPAEATEAEATEAEATEAEAVPETAAEFYIEHVDPSGYKHEFLDAHTLTRADLKGLFDEDAVPDDLPKELVWDRSNKFRIKSSGLTPELAEAILTDPQFKRVEK